MLLKVSHVCVCTVLDKCKDSCIWMHGKKVQKERQLPLCALVCWREQRSILLLSGWNISKFDLKSNSDGFYKVIVFNFRIRKILQISTAYACWVCKEKIVVVVVLKVSGASWEWRLYLYQAPPLKGWFTDYLKLLLLLS